MPNGPAPRRVVRAARGARGYGRRVTTRPDGPDGEGSATELGTVLCARCGAAADGPLVSWTLSVEGGVRRHYCEVCSRENLRAIEGRLDAEWW